MGQKSAVLIQETEDGRPELWCSVFSCLPVILSQTTMSTWFHSSASGLILKEIDGGVFDKYHSLRKVEGFCKLIFEV